MAKIEIAIFYHHYIQQMKKWMIAKFKSAIKNLTYLVFDPDIILNFMTAQSRYNGRMLGCANQSVA